MKFLHDIWLSIRDGLDLTGAWARERFAGLGSAAGTRLEEPAFLRFSTMAGPLLVYAVRSEDAGDTIRVMEVDAAYQSATYLEDGREYDPPFGYIRAYDCIYEARDDFGNPAAVANLLMLGGGGFSYPKHVVAHHPESRIDAIELDPTVVALARRYFFLDRLELEFDTEETGRLGAITQDALVYLEEHAAEDNRLERPLYDAILNDLFRGKAPVEGLTTMEGAQLVKRCLAPGGLYVSNVIGATSEGAHAEMLRRIIAEYRKVFAHVYVLLVEAIQCKDGQENSLLIASDKAWAIPGAEEV